MDTDRPFSGPLSVSLAGLTLVAISAASFTSGLTRQLRLPRADHSAQVVVLTPKPAAAPPPAPAETLAVAAAAPAEPAHRPSRHARAPDSVEAAAPPLVVGPEPAAIVASAALERGVDAAATPPALAESPDGAAADPSPSATP